MSAGTRALESNVNVVRNEIVALDRTIMLSKMIESARALMPQPMALTGRSNQPDKLRMMIRRSYHEPLTAMMKRHYMAVPRSEIAKSMASMLVKYSRDEIKSRP